MRTLMLFLGIASFAAPGLAYLLEGRAEEEADLLAWLMSRPLEQIYLMQGMVLGGMLLISGAVMLR